MTEPLYISSASLAPIVKIVGVKIKQLRSEIRAADAGAIGPVFLMYGLLVQTLDRLRRGQITDSWWQEILNKLGHKFVAPDFLKKPALRQWLSIREVEEALLSITSAHIMGTSIDDEANIYGQLSQRYADVTGEAEHLAKRPIEVVIAVLTAGFIARIPSNQHAIAAMIQQLHQQVTQIDTKLDLIPSNFSDPAVQKLRTEIVTTELTSLLLHRMFDVGHCKKSHIGTAWSCGERR